MEKMPKYGKVSSLPFHIGILSREKLDEIRNLDFVGKQPRNMDYRIQFIKGYGASTKDSTWDRINHVHTCCLSKAAWRHRASCFKVLSSNTDDLSDLKEI